MIEVRSRAPGKFILAGEHAINHGSTAVAASIALYTSVNLHLPSDNDDTLTLHLMDVGHSITSTYPNIKVDRSWWRWMYSNSITSTVFSATVTDKVIEELERCGFQCFITETGGIGLEICFDGRS